MGKTASINLSTGEVTVAATPRKDLELYLGGRGLGAALLYRMAAGHTDPYAAETPVIFTPGTLTGTSWPSSARGNITFHSPATGVYGCANSSGHFWAALNQAGYDALVFTGIAPEPVYLEVTPDAVTVVPAGDLWGKGTEETTQRLSEGGGKVACIGQAGENCVKIAGLITDGNRAAARAGGGAAIGAKRLKAVVVRGAKGGGSPKEFIKTTGAKSRKVRAHPESVALNRWGTPLLIVGKNIAGDLPAYNHQSAQVPWWGKMDAEAVDALVLKHRACHACPIGCDHITRVPDGPYATELGGPEYETIDALGPMVGMQDLPALIWANKLCNDYGLDTISTGVAIAFAMELHQRGLLDDPDLSLCWGDIATVHGLIDAIAFRRGLGDTLAEGVRGAAQRLGPETVPYAMHVKGLELPRQEPRIAKAFGLAHSVANRGADHLTSLPTVDIAHNWDACKVLFPEEMWEDMMQLGNEKYKADLVVISEHFSTASDALGLCKFTTTETWALMPDDVAEGLSAYRGETITGDQLMKAGERIINLERLFNARLGLDRNDDRLPARFTQEPLHIHAYSVDGNGEVQKSAEPVNVSVVEDHEAMLDRYYRLRGWDERGLPTAEKLAELGLN